MDFWGLNSWKNRRKTSTQKIHSKIQNRIWDSEGFLVDFGGAFVLGKTGRKHPPQKSTARFKTEFGTPRPRGHRRRRKVPREACFSGNWLIWTFQKVGNG